MLFKEIIIVYSENSMKLKAGGIYSDCWALKD
jgi:hypothetical protein